jgi:hypothetical protein
LTQDAAVKPEGQEYFLELNMPPEHNKLLLVLVALVGLLTAADIVAGAVPQN